MRVMADEMTNVLIVRVPRAIEDINKCLDYIKRGLREGVLILGADVSYSIEKFPPLGSVKIEESATPKESIPSTQKEPVPELGTGKTVEAPEKLTDAQSEPSSPPTLQVRGAGAAEKRRIFAKLCAYRDRTGAG